MSDIGGYSTANADLFARYLTAKRSIDDRSLNRHVYGALCEAISQAGPSAPLRILEVGCGIGAMAARLSDWGLFARLPNGSTYLGIDADESLIARARTLPVPPSNLAAAFEAAVFQDFAAQPQALASFDLLIAHAVLDLLDLETTLPAMHSLLRDGGLGWLTINFDGVTHFEPAIDDALDTQIEAYYHETMDRRMYEGKPSGDSRTGRHLLTALVGAGFDVLAAGASDWVVHPTAGRYHDDDAWFLTFIVDTVYAALLNHPRLQPDSLAAWRLTRREQIERGLLCYIAHQIDFLVRRPGATAECE